MVYLQLASLPGTPVNTTVDVLGVVRLSKPCTTITTRDGKMLKKREVVLADASGGEARLTLWGTDAELPDAQLACGTVLSVSCAKVGEFQGRTLGTTRYSVVHVWHDELSAAEDEHVAALRAWVRAHGGSRAAKLPSSFALVSSTRKHITEVRAAPPAVGAKPEWCALKATVLSVRGEHAWYAGCAQCAKKVLEDAAGKWVCTPCGKRYDRPRHRYVLNVVLADASGSQVVTLFDDAAHALLSMSADEAEEMHAATPAKFRAALSAPEFTSCLFDVSVKQEAREERTMQKGKTVMVTKVQLRVAASRLGALNFPAECARMLAQLR